jgi:methylated-DNA-[protein]-cysteine S-methyltransferase
MMQAAQHYTLFETAIGACGVAWSDRGLTRLLMLEKDAHAAERRLRARTPDAVAASPPDHIARLIDEVRTYATGAKVNFALAQLDLSAVPEFNAKVFAAAREVGWGQTTTYGALGRAIGAPLEMARDVGQALGRNPVPIIVPCHRVLAAGGKSGGFSAPGGVTSKARLLALEGVRLALPAKPDTSQHAFDFADRRS